MSAGKPLLQFEWLDELAYNTFSQWGEDGVLQAIFSIIGAANEWCVECGASDGIFLSNTRLWIEEGWRAVLIEASASCFKRLLANCNGFGERVTCVNAQIDNEHRLETVLHRAGAPLDLDLAVIDVDGQDYYLFNSLLRYRPRVVVLEYDHRADEYFIPRLRGEGQAGLKAILSLASSKYYTEVFRTITNVILVKQPLDQLLSGTKEHMLNRVLKANG